MRNIALEAMRAEIAMLVRTIVDVAPINRRAGASRASARAVTMRASKRIAGNGAASFLPARCALAEYLNSSESGTDRYTEPIRQLTSTPVITALVSCPVGRKWNVAPPMRRIPMSGYSASLAADLTTGCSRMKAATDGLNE